MKVPFGVFFPSGLEYTIMYALMQDLIERLHAEVFLSSLLTYDTLDMVKLKTG